MKQTPETTGGVPIRIGTPRSPVAPVTDPPVRENRLSAVSKSE